MSPLDERGQPCPLMVKKDCYVPHEYEGLSFSLVVKRGPHVPNNNGRILMSLMMLDVWPRTSLGAAGSPHDRDWGYQC